MTFLRQALITVPLVVLLGIASGVLSGSGYDNGWFAALDKPAFTPPGWVFAVAWTILYTMLGLALALVLHARGSRFRRVAAAAFAVALLLNLAWSPLFFAAHSVHAALWLIGAMFAAALLATWLFARVRTGAALLMLPYLGWLLFAGLLNLEIDRMNPDAAALAPGRANTQIRV
jgi:benzodiazapine receptor